MHSDYQESRGRDSLDSLGFYCVAFFVFGIFSSIVDYIVTYHVRALFMLRPTLVTAIIGLGIVLIKGRFAELTNRGIGRTLLILSCWIVACIPLSIWPGGAFRMLTDQWYIAMLTFFLVAGLLVTPEACLKLATVIGTGGVLLALITLKSGQYSVEGRLGLINTRYGNPNDLAMNLVTTIPLLLFLLFRSGTGKLLRAGVLAGMVPILIVIVKTGSRGALVGALASCVVIFLHVGFANRMKMIVVGVILMAVAVATVPDRLLDRFGTIFGDESVRAEAMRAFEAGDTGLIASIDSAYSRKQLLLDSITLTLTHPIWGVGPGLFPTAQDQLARDRGEHKGSWHVTHNAFTQVSSETGLVGLFLYMAMIVQAFRALSRTLALRYPGGRSQRLYDIQNLCIAMRLAMTAFLASAFFASVAYLPTVPLLCAYSYAIELCATRMVNDARRRQAPAGQSEPGVAMPRPFGQFPSTVRPMPARV